MALPVDTSSSNRKKGADKEAIPAGAASVNTTALATSKGPVDSHEKVRPLTLHTFYKHTIETLKSTIAALTEDLVPLRTAAGDFSSTKMEHMTTKYENKLKKIDDRLIVLREKKK